MSASSFDRVSLVIVAALASAVFCLGLGRPYLWQDEAATAVLGERMIHHGRPLGYDGRNLITMDASTRDDLEAMLAEKPADAVAYFVKRGDFREDTAWIGQPWGQFLAAGAAVALLGKHTAAARAPFALASLITVVLLFHLVRGVLRDRLTAAIAAGLLLLNPYWVLHGRQCRYYALSGLFALITVAAFARWQRGGRLAGTWLVVSVWCWFQADFGGCWPVIGALVVLGAISRPGWRSAVRVAVAIGVVLAPFATYYRLAERMKVPWEGWVYRITGLVFNENQYVVPYVVLAGAVVALAHRRRSLDRSAVGLLMVSILVVLAAAPWSAIIAPAHFHRYVVHVTPLACLVVAWALVEAGAWLARRTSHSWLRPAAAVGLAGVLVVSPVASNAVSWAILGEKGERPPRGSWIRPELSLAIDAIFRDRPDPNREAITIVAARAHPDDEVLVAYEDVPFMFYTPYGIRGGIAGFRINDRSTPPPRFLVVRPGVPFGQTPLFKEEVNRYRWTVHHGRSPALWWGNSPDPQAQALYRARNLPTIVVGERMADEPGAP